MSPISVLIWVYVSQFEESENEKVFFSSDTNDREVQEREVIVGIVTDIDLLHHIARHETGSGSGELGSGSSGECSPRNKSASETSN